MAEDKGDLAAKIAAQGDIVRKLKQEKADKEKVSDTVKVGLLSSCETRTHALWASAWQSKLKISYLRIANFSLKNT